MGDGALAALALNKYGSMEGVGSGRTAGGEQLSVGQRAGRVAANLGATALFPEIATLSRAIEALPRLIATALGNAPLTATITPSAAALAQAGNGSSGSMPPTPR